MLEIRVLGQFDVRLDGQPVEIPSRPAQSLLAYLALTAGVPHRRERLAGLFWPDAAETNARSNLRHALWRLRAAIEKNDHYLLADALSVAFNADANYWLDAAVLQQEFSGDWPAEELMEAISVYNGELLPGFYDEWTGPERERLQAVFERQMQKLLDRLVVEERWAEVLAWGEHWIALGNVPEPAYRALMAGYGGLDDKAGVAIAYQRCVEALRTGLGVEPAAQTQALYERLSRSEKPSPPPLTVMPPQPAAPALAHNLPAQSTPFIGRVEALAELARLLDDPACRLLTLTGPGGIGKTRLALQAAAEGLSARKFTDGVFFVPLAPLGSVDFIVPAIANAIAFTFYGGMDSKDQLLNYLREKSILLVMDNFEHLTDGAGLLAEFLERAPGLKCMVTSRERLNLRGEWLIEVEGMTAPESEQAERVEEYSAMQLFLQSARRTHPRFTLSEEDKQHAARICRLVEGLPLAIELASAWVRAISLREIAKEIEHNLDFLATTLRDVPERHRSLRAVFDHSWNLLTAEEKRVFRTLSVFRGGLQREAAEAVAEAPLPLLSALMDKSLLRRSPSGRYEIHELLRQYARDKLIEAGEEIQIRNRHLTYFLSLAEEAEPMLRRAEQVAWLGRLETEHDNLRAALKWAATDEQLEDGLRLAGALARFWYLHGYWSEGREWLKKLLEVSQGESDGRTLKAGRAKALYGAGWLEDESGADGPLYEQSLALGREIDDKWGMAFSLRGLGALAIRRGEEARAAVFLSESLALFEELGERWGTALVKFNLGWLVEYRDKYDEKMRFWEESLAGFRDAGDRWGQAVTLGALGYSARFEGDYKRAAAMSKESLQLFKELGDKAGMAESLARLASVAHRRSDYKQATTLYAESLTLREELGDRLGMMQTKGLLGLVAAYQGDYGRATALLEESLQASRELASRESATYLASYLATAAYFQGNLERASALWEETLVFYRELNDRVAVAYSINYLGIVALQRGDPARAGALLQEAYDQIRGTGDKRGLALALHGLGRLAHAQGDEAGAVSLFKQGLTLRREMGDKQGIAESLESLAGALGRCDEKGAAEGAARLFGAADHLREKIGSPLPPVEGEAYQRDVATVRSRLDDGTFTTAWAAGREMSLDEVLGEALA